MSFFLDLQKNITATPIEKVIIDYIINHPNKVMEMSMEELASETYTSRSTISRFCKKNGYNGFNDLKMQLAIELNLFLKDSGLMHNISWPFNQDDDVETIIDKIVSQNTYSLLETIRTNSAEKLVKIVDKILHADNVVFLGVQFSGIAAYDAHMRFSKIGISSKFFITESDILTYSYYANPKDTVFFFSYSGETSFILDAAKYVKHRGAYSISITRNHNNELLEHCNVHLYINSIDDPENNLSLSSRLATLCLIDVLYGILISKKNDSVYDRLMQNNKIYKKYFGD